MEGRGEGVAVSKPTGANKRKGANPVRQIINDGVVADGGGVGGGGGPLDLSLQHGDMQPRSSSKKVILSVPQYKLVTSSSTTSASALSVSSSSRLSDPPPAPVTSLKQEPGELSVTPVIKKERLSGSDEDEEDLDTKVEDSSGQGNSFAGLHSFLSSQSQALFSLEQLKQASLIFQKHALNGNTVPGWYILTFSQHSNNW